MWFKVTINKDGSVASCENVGAALENGKAIRYVEADNQESALRIVAAWQRSLARGRVRNSEIGVSLRRAGICSRCHREPRVAGRASCEACLKWAMDYQRGINSGAHVPAPKKTEQESVKLFTESRARRDAEFTAKYGSAYQHAKKVARRDTLCEVLQKLEHLPAIEFRRWLIAETDAAIAARPPHKTPAWRQKVAAAE